jgi:hypothetical protein
MAARVSEDVNNFVQPISRIFNNLNAYFCVCFDVMYSDEYNVFDVTLSVYPHRAG